LSTLGHLRERLQHGLRRYQAYDRTPVPGTTKDTVDATLAKYLVHRQGCRTLLLPRALMPFLQPCATASLLGAYHGGDMRKYYGLKVDGLDARC